VCWKSTWQQSGVRQSAVCLIVTIYSEEHAKASSGFYSDKEGSRFLHTIFSLELPPKVRVTVLKVGTLLRSYTLSHPKIMQSWHHHCENLILHARSTYNFGNVSFIKHKFFVTNRYGLFTDDTKNHLWTPT